MFAAACSCSGRDWRLGPAQFAAQLGPIKERGGPARVSSVAILGDPALDALMLLALLTIGLMLLPESILEYIFVT